MLKLIFKEDFTPSHIKHKFFFTIAPAIVFIASFLTFAVIPYADVLTIDEKKEVLKLLKKKLACGGSISDEWLELQGDVKEKIKTVLEADGWKFRK